MTNKRIQLSTNVDGQNVNVYPVTKSEFVEFSDGKTLNDKLNNMDGNHEHGLATPAKDGFMSKEDKAKLDGVNNYTHPSTHAATMITEDATHRFVTDAEKTKWNNKADTTMASKTNAGLMSASDKQRIDGLNAEFKTRDDKITKNTEDIKSWNDEMINKEYQYFNGKDITIENSIVSKTTDMIIKGRTLQNVMPELNKSNFNFTGETNLVDGFFVIPFGVDVNASLIGVNRKKTILKPNTKYTVIADILENNTGQKLGMSSYGCSFVPSKNSFDNSVGISMITGTTKDNFNNVEIKTDFLFCIWGNGGDLSKKIKFKAMVLEGDWTNKPIPNYFEGIKSFGQQEDKISILSNGKNLWNKELFVPKLLDINSWETRGAYRNNEQMIYLEKGKYYITIPDILVPPRLYPVLGIKDKSGTSLGSILTGGVYNNEGSDTPKLVPKRTTTFTIIDEGYHYFNGIFQGGWTQENLNKYKSILESNFQIERSSSPTEYEPYKEDKKDILLQSLGFDEGLRGINDISDELNSLRNVAIKRIGKREYREGDLLLDNVITDKVNTYYVLEEPIETPLDENINLKTFNEKTYITSDNIIKGDLSFTVPMNTAANLEINTTRLNNIEDYIDNNKDNKNRISKLEEGLVTSSLNIIDLQKEIKNDSNYTHYEGKNVIINNLSKNSRTSNMLIKGQTYHNLIGNIKNDIRSWVDKDDKYSLNLPLGNGQPSLLFNLCYQLKANQKYTIISEMTNYSSGYLHFSFMNENGNALASTTEIVANSIGINKFVFTIKNDIEAKTLRLLPRANIDNIYTISKKIMILEGDWTNKEIPNYFEGIKSFGETENNTLKLLSSGKNLLELKQENFVNGNVATLKNNTIKIKYSNPFEVMLNKNSPIKVKKGKLSISFIQKIASGDGVNLKITPYGDPNTILFQGNTNKSFEISKDRDLAVYIVRAGSKGDVEISNIQLEEGDISSYEIYNEDRNDIALKQPIRSLPIGIADVLRKEYNKLIVTRNINSLTITSENNNIKLLPSNEKFIVFQILVDDMAKDIQYSEVNIQNRNSLCSNLCWARRVWDLTDEFSLNLEGYSVSNANGCFYIKILKSRLNTPTLEGLKEWLKTNPITIVYELINPITEIESNNCLDTNLSVYKGNTYIKTLNSIQGELNFDIPNNLNTQIKENTLNINKSIDSLKVNYNKISELENAQMTTALNVLELQKHRSMLNNGEINEYSNHTGTFIECNNTLDSRTEGMIIKGKTLQNLLDYSKFSTNEYSTDGVTIRCPKGDSRPWTQIKSLSDLLEPNTEYTLYVKNIGNNPGRVQYKYGGDGFGPLHSDLYSGDEFKVTFRTDSQPYFAMKFYFIISETPVETICEAMLIKGKATVINDYFSNIKSIGEAECNKISILSYGSNILDYNEYIGTLSIAQSYKRQPISLKANIDYRIELVLDNVHVTNQNICIWTFRGENGKNIKQVAPTATFRLTDSEVAQIKTIDLFIGNNETVINKKITSIQLKEGTKNTNFEPYKEDKKDILIKEPLMNVGDIYDIMHEYNNKIIVERNIGKLKIDGRVTPIIFSQFSTNTHIAFYISVEGENNYGLPVYPNKAFTFKGNGDTVLCDKFKISDKIVLSDISDEAVCLVNASPNYVGFKILKSKIKTGDITYNDVKEYLKENPVTVYYQKAEPTIEIVESIDIDVDTYKDKTYITTDNEIQGELEFKTQNNFGAIMKNVNRCISKIFNSLNNILNIKGE